MTQGIGMDDLAPMPSRRPGAAPRGNRRRPLFWLTLASLGLNLFLIGGLVGIGRHWLGHRPPQGPEHMIEQMAAILPAPDAAILRTAFAARHDRFQAAQQDLHAAMDQVRAVAAAPTLDPDALRAAIEDAARKRMAIGTVIGETMIDAITRMSPESRVLVTRRPPDPPPPRE